MRTWLITICMWLLMASGSFLLVLGGMDYWESHKGQNEVSEEWQQLTPDGQAGRPSSSGTVPRVAPPPPGAAVARLTIPRLNAVLYVVEGADNRNLKRGPGHLTGTVLPGEEGNCVIAGHRDTHFRILKDIQKGDEVILSRDGHEFRYKVEDTQIVLPTNTASLKPTEAPVLNLVTCYPFYYVGSAPKRFIVHAALDPTPLQAVR